MHLHSSTPPEEWRPVVGYEGWYEVSSQGRVRRAAPGKGTHIGYVLKPRMGWHYFTVGLRRLGYPQRMVFIHRLVAEAFLGGPPPGFEANHKDGDKLNNRPGNLEWVTPSQNCRHALANGLSVPARGEQKTSQAKLSDVAVRVIRATEGYGCGVKLAQRFGVSGATISRVRRRLIWKHI